ncbi:MAG: hypothetical protein NEA02_13915 [Thermoanaerobaculia bacterium]|nr:hypothetical protein [Thermoanaerobaculia bacterium]
MSTRQPRIRVCVAGVDEATRSTFTASLDGETISRGFTWSEDCAQWSPHGDWLGLGKRHAWSDPPYDEDGWLAGMRDGTHHFVASVSPSTGEEVIVRTHFRVETEQHAVSLGIGFPKMSLEGFDGPFASTNLLEVRFGPQRVSTIAKDAGVLRYTDKAISIGGASTRLADGGDPGETETSLWRFMAGRRQGYGYRTGDVAFIAPYQGNSAFFADFDAYEGPYTPADQLALAPFNGHTRVGTGFEGGIAFGINRSITLDAGFEETAVYPHWVFWPALGSGAIHGIALSLADGVSRQVARVSPRAAPIVSFVLRNTISYVIFHQRRSEVNWPFGGGPGLIYEGFKVSFTFTY